MQRLLLSIQTLIVIVVVVVFTTFIVIDVIVVVIIVVVIVWTVNMLFPVFATNAVAQVSAW